MIDVPDVSAVNIPELAAIVPTVGFDEDQVPPDTLADKVVFAPTHALYAPTIDGVAGVLFMVTTSVAIVVQPNSFA